MALDAVVGDPRWLPHPVRAIGALAARLETITRRVVPSVRAAGVLTVVVVVGSAGAAVWLLVRAAAAIHPILGDAAAILLLATTLAARDLAGHALAVFRALDRGDLPEARQKAAFMVSRETAGLDESETARAAVESVAENTVDGVTAPLLFAALGGPAAAMMYKAVNTLDSMFGYKTGRYLKFGWASARLDDAVNYIPARITAAFVPLAAMAVGARPLQSLRCLVRDGKKHPSPNSGLAEAAMAGALGVRLGGVSSYFGAPSTKPYLGEPLEPLGKGHIRRTVALMVATYLLAALLFLGVRTFVWNG
ncbi:MAG: adenosylcobinamide-phosphate synthase CbiB [Candidatus Methylomirabilia bacterium]